MKPIRDYADYLRRREDISARARVADSRLASALLAMRANCTHTEHGTFRMLTGRVERRCKRCGLESRAKP